MRKRLTKVRFRGIKIAIASLFLLASLVIVSFAITTTHAALAASYLHLDTTTITPTPILPLPTPTPTPTQAPTPTAQPQPTMTPATPAPAAPTPTPVPAQQNPAANASSGAVSNQAPTPTPGIAPTPTFMHTAPSTTTANAPASTQQQGTNSPLDAIFGPVGVTIMLLFILGAAGALLLQMRRKQPAPALAGNSAYNSTNGAADYAPFPPAPQVFSQTAQPAPAPIPAMTQREIVLSSSQPGQFSPNMHGEVTEVHEAVSPSYAPGSDFNTPRSDLDTPRTDYPGRVESKANENREKVPQPRGAAVMPSVLPETPSHHNGGLSEQGQTEMVNTDQLMAIIREAQAGLFVIPEREQEKQTR